MVVAATKKGAEATPKTRFHSFNERYSFDLSIAQRWILKKVFDLGWTMERFRKFDRFVTSARVPRSKWGSHAERFPRPAPYGIGLAVGFLIIEEPTTNSKTNSSWLPTKILRFAQNDMSLDLSC